jgi:hypothetical protein
MLCDNANDGAVGGRCTVDVDVVLFGRCELHEAERAARLYVRDLGETIDDPYNVYRSEVLWVDTIACDLWPTSRVVADMRHLRKCARPSRARKRSFAQHASSSVAAAIAIAKSAHRITSRCPCSPINTRLRIHSSKNHCNFKQPPVTISAPPIRSSI